MPRRFRTSALGRDPYWTTARFASTCSCGHPISQGDRIFYYPNQRTAVCAEPCGAQGSAELECAKQDEAVLMHDAYAERIDASW